MTSPSNTYAPPPPYGPAYWYRPPHLNPAGAAVRFAIGILVVLLLLAAIRAMIVGTAEGGVPWLDVAGALGIALSVLIGFAVLALVLAVVFGLVLPAVSGKGGDWMNPARWAAFEATKDVKMRYARGEISRDDYLRIMRDLEPGSFAAEAPAPNAAAKP